MGGTPDPRAFMSLELVSAVGSLLNNPWQEAFVQSVTTNVKLTYARELVRLRGARALEPEFIRNLHEQIYPPKSIVVAYTSGAGVAFKGQVAEKLPPGALDSIRQETSSFAPQVFASEQRHVIELRGFMIGSETVSVKIRPPLRCPCVPVVAESQLRLPWKTPDPEQG